MRPLLAALLLLLSASRLLAEDPPAQRGPRLVLEKKALDFGEVVQGAKVRLALELGNSGDAPLVISHAETTCGCSLARLPEAPIPPGGKGELVVEFDSSDRTGQQGFEVYVYGNDPTQADRGAYCTHLVVKGEVRNEFRLAPRGAYFGELVRGGPAQERVVKVTGTGAAKGGFQPRLQGERPDWLEVTVSQAQPGGREAEVKVRLLPHAPRGEHLLQLVLATGLEAQPELRVPVAVTVAEQVLAPGAIVLGSLRRGQPWGESRIPIERLDAPTLSVRGLELDEKLIRARVVQVTPRRIDLLVSAAPELPPGALCTELRVRLDAPSHPLLRLPVYAAILPRVEVEPLELLLSGGEARASVRGARLRGARLEPAEAASAWQVELLPPAPGGAGVLLRAGSPDAAPPAAVVLETDAPGEEQVRIPVRAR